MREFLDTYYTNPDALIASGLIRLFRVRLRRCWPVKREAEAIDGGTYWFTYGYPQDATDRYPGEDAWTPADRRWPAIPVSWVSSGDLEEVSDGDLHQGAGA